MFRRRARLRLLYQHFRQQIAVSSRKLMLCLGRSEAEPRTQSFFALTVFEAHLTSLTRQLLGSDLAAVDSKVCEKRPFVSHRYLLRSSLFFPVSFGSSSSRKSCCMTNKGRGIEESEVSVRNEGDALGRPRLFPPRENRGALISCSFFWNPEWVIKRFDYSNSRSHLSSSVSTLEPPCSVKQTSFLSSQTLFSHPPTPSSPLLLSPPITHL